MLVTFRVKDKTTRLHSEPAEISALELASLMRRLHAGHADIETESHEFSATPLNFEVNANSLSLASFAACFDWRAEVIAIVEEAQFLGRTLRVHCPGGPSPITIMVSEHIALARDIPLPSELSAKVVRALGQGDGSEGEIPLDALRPCLAITIPLRPFELPRSRPSSKACRSLHTPIAANSFQQWNGRRERALR